MATSPEFPHLPWVPPRSFTAGRPGPPLWIVLHYTAGSEGPTSAEDGAAYDARRTDGTSCHFFIDRNSVVQCVRTTDTAHSAYANGNARGIHLELCGTAQTRAQWLDDASRATIRNAAAVAALCMAKYGMPARRLGVAEVAGRSAKGYCDHAAITAAFPADHGDHGDVGPGFPWDVFAADLHSIVTGEGYDMELHEAVNAIVWGSTDTGFLTGKEKEGDHGYQVKRAAEVNLRLLSGKLDALTAKVDAIPAGKVVLDDDQLAGLRADLLAGLPTVEEIAGAVADEHYRRQKE